MNVKITKVVLHNFRQFKDYTFNFGNRTEISGENKIGKTGGAFASVMWCLFGKDSDFNQKNIENIPTDSEGNIEKDIETSVETFVNVDGVESSFKRILTQKWDKKSKLNDNFGREVLKGTTSEYFLGDLPAKKSDFDIKVNEIGEESLIKVICNPNYFSRELPWKDRRDILTSMITGITHRQLVENGDFDLIKSDVVEKGVDDTRTLYNSQLKNANKDVNDYPAKIDEASRNIIDVSDIPVNSLVSKRDQLNLQIKQLKEDENFVDKDFQEKQKQLIAKKGEFDKAIADVMAEKSQAGNVVNNLPELKTKKQGFLNQISQLSNSISSAETSSKSLQSENAQFEADILTYRQGWVEEDSKTFPTESSVCPCCGQVLPEDKLEEARKTFNQEIDKKKSDYIAWAEQKKNKIDINVSSIANNQKLIEQNRTTITELTNQVKPVSEQILAIESTPPVNLSEFDIRIQNLQTEKQKAQIELSALTPKTVNNQAKISELNIEVDTISNKLSSFDSSNKAKKRVEELKKEQKKKNNVVTMIEGKIETLDELMKTYINANTDQVNALFDENITVQLFEQQMNGNWKECCNMIVKDERGAMVDFKEASTGAKIQAGMQIADIIQVNKNLRFPMWIDNAESVHPLYPADTQLIIMRHVPLQNEIKIMEV